MKKKLKIIDLSLMFYEGMQTYHKRYHPKFKRIKSATHEKHKREVSLFKLAVILALILMLQDILSKMEKQLIIDIDHFCGKAILINLVKKPKNQLYLLKMRKKRSKTLKVKL